MRERNGFPSAPPLVPPLPAGLVVEDAQGSQLPEFRSHRSGGQIVFFVCWAILEDLVTVLIGSVTLLGDQRNSHSLRPSVL